MNSIRRIRRIRIGRIAAMLAALATGLAACLLGFGVTPAFARLQPLAPDGPAPVPVRTVTHTVVLGGMPGWQIALIAIGAALLAATLTVLADRARAARRPAVPRAA
jgi:hypothetical protein